MSRPAPAPAFVPPTAAQLQSDFSFTQKKENEHGQFILLLGPPFSGKTTSCLTFKNPRFINLDNKVPRGTLCVPFTDPAFCDKLAPRTSLALPVNKRDAVYNWLFRNAARLPKDITLILDGLSSLSDAFHMQTEGVEDVGRTQNDKIDPRKIFGAKINYLESIFFLLKLAPCRVIVTAHTMPEYNEKGEPTGSIKPLVTGSFSDKIIGYATDCYRAYVDIDPQTGKPRVDATGKCIGYRWQMKPDLTCTYTNTLMTLPPGKSSILAEWSELEVLIKANNPEAAPASEPAAVPSATGTTVQ